MSPVAAQMNGQTGVDLWFLKWSALNYHQLTINNFFGEVDSLQKRMKYVFPCEKRMTYCARSLKCMFCKLSMKQTLQQ